MEFEWDENKNQKNIEKHGIDFKDAKEAFKDERMKKSPDLRFDYGEERWKGIGTMLGSVIVSIIFTVRQAVTRIISARRANQKERDEYNNQ